VDKRLAGRAADEGVDYVGVGDVGELISLLGEALNVLSEGLIGSLPIVAKVLGVCWAGVATLDAADEDRIEITQAVHAVRLKLLEPSFSRA
jgi:hypothetical protein